MISITRKLEFDAGHRVLKHESKCKHLHGHRYVAEVTVTAPELDQLGRVIDFGVIKTEVGGWIDQNWDHNLILHPADPLLHVLTVLRQDGEQILEGANGQVDAVLGGKEPFVLDGNPTAENMARVLFQVASELLRSYDIDVVRVRLFETPNCSADYVK